MLFVFREIKAKGIKKSAPVHQFRSRAGNVQKLQEETRGRFSKFVAEKKPNSLEDDNDIDINMDELIKA